MQINTEQLKYLKSLIRDDCGLFIDDIEPGEDWILIDESDAWTQDGKYQSCEFVVQHVSTGSYFNITNSRTGSYHTDWYYSEPLIQQVIKVEKVVTITEWQGVK